MPPQRTTSCMVPAEVRAAAPDFKMGTLTAYGRMESFSYPPRPADPKAAWNLEWTARVRHRSTTSWMQARRACRWAWMMKAMAAGSSGQPAEASARRGGLGGMLGGVGISAAARRRC
jgi:hypothetical protein